MNIWMRRAAVLLLVLAVAGGGWFAYERWIAREPLPEGLVQANGRIEGDDVLVAAEFGGRLESMPAKEGDHVQQGELLATLEDEQTRSRVQEAEKRVQRLEAQAAALQEELAVLEQEVPLDVQRAEKALQAARADEARARAEQDQAAREAARYAELLERDTVARQAAERFTTAYRTARKQVDAAEATTAERRKALEQAKLGHRRLEAKRQEVQAAVAATDRARAARKRAAATLKDLQVRAPAGGVVTERVAELGEVVPAGGVLYRIVDLDSLYLKAYVPEKQAVRLAPGQPARVHPDNYPGEYAPATLRYVASEAEFTPKEVQTPEQRTELVYAVKLYLDANPDHRLTPGLPADAVIKVGADAPWAAPRW